MAATTAHRVSALDPQSAVASAIIAESDAFYDGLYPAESNHLDAAEDLSKSTVVFLGCYNKDDLAACGAIKLMRDDGDYAELKRLYVRPAFRGQGLSRILMTQLEAVARDWQLSLIRLETGTRQPEALALYEKLGYRRRAPFGQYQPDPLSVFMEKSLLV